MDLFTLCGITYAVSYLVVAMDEYINWVKSYHDAAEELRKENYE